MKCVLFLALALGLPLTSSAADTAYTAIRAVGKQNGDDALNRVLEVRGRMGAPEPQVWKIVLADSGSRGGIHEFEVQHGRITGERAPTARALSGGTLDLNKLNIDSDGAFTIANQETQKLGLPFDRVDYTLTAGARGSVAAWHMELFDAHKGRVGAIDIAADTGSVVHRDLAGAGAPHAADDHAYLHDRPAPEAVQPVYPDDHRRYVEDRRYADGRRYPDDGTVYGDDPAGPGIFDIFGKITRHFDKRTRQIKNFFSGR